VLFTHQRLKLKDVSSVASLHIKLRDQISSLNKRAAKMVNSQKTSEHSSCIAAAFLMNFQGCFVGASDCGSGVLLLIRWVLSWYRE
jgi:hypothetical protein